MADGERTSDLDNGWKQLHIDGRTWIVPDSSVARSVLVTMAAAFLVVCLGIAFSNLSNVSNVLAFKVAIACAAIGVLTAGVTVLGRRREERLGNYVEPAGSRSIRLPRNGLTLTADVIDSVLISEGNYETSELSIRVLQLSIGTRLPSSPFVPVITTSHRAGIERAAHAIAHEVGVPMKHDHTGK